jgi:hypothetical protein
VERFRTVLEQKIRERRQTFEEFAEYAEMFAREHNEPGTVSARHLQRLAAGHGPKGQPLGPPRPATARLLERIFKLSITELLAPPSRPTATSERTVNVLPLQRNANRGSNGVQGRPSPIAEVDLTVCFEWLDEHAGWIPGTSLRKARARLTKVSTGELLDQQAQRARVSRSRTAEAMSAYYGNCSPDYDMYQVRRGEQKITTSIMTRPDWLDLCLPLDQGLDQLTLVNPPGMNNRITFSDIGARHAIRRLVEAVALGVRITNVPTYRLASIDVARTAITGTISIASFVEYALTMDLLENELADAISAGAATSPGRLSLRDCCLPDIPSVLDFQGRLCAGGVLALCAVARPSDAYRGEADYALLVQHRSGHVLNAARQLAVIPKGFHQPMTDFRGDTPIGATMRREMEEELFGRSEVDSTLYNHRAASPMHPGRLSDPLRWIMENGRSTMECTAFGLNLISGNYEFACLIVIEDEEFWAQYGGQIEANWESAGMRVYSSLDNQMISDLVTDEAWSNEGLFALVQGLRRLRELGGSRVDLPAMDLDLTSSS